MRSSWLAALVTVALASPAAAHPSLARPTPLAPAAAIVPGVAIHGAGHFVAGERAIATRLLIAEGVAIAGIGTSLSVLALSGASRRVVAPAAVLAVTSVGLLIVSGLADLYGVVAPPRGFGTPLRAMPTVETHAGVRAIHDPHFAHSWFAMQGVAARSGPLLLAGEAWQAPNGPTAQMMALAAVRLNGPNTRVAAAGIDGSFLDLVSAVTHRAFRGDGFSTLTAELRLSGRLDLHRFARTLRGSFAELQFGGAVARHRYAFGGVEGDGLLLVRLAYGVYVGRGSEIALTYDHRRDSIVGGMLLRGIGAGYVGVVGLQGRYFFDPMWGFAADVQVGSAYTAGLSLLFRQGAVTW